MNLRIKYLREIIFCCVFRLLNFIFDILWVINFLILDEFWVDDPRYGTLFLLCDWYFLLQENILFLEENVLQEFLSSRYNAIWIRNLLVFLWLWVSLKHIFWKKDVTFYQRAMAGKHLRLPKSWWCCRWTRNGMVQRFPCVSYYLFI